MGRWLPPVLFLMLAFGLFASVGTDDSYLTYWAAHTLSSSGEILNYNGARIEQSSSLLHVLILAALNRITTLSLPTLGVLIGLACGALTVAMTQRLAGLVDKRLSLPAGFLVAMSTPVLYWSMGGLETTLTTAVAGFLLVSIAARTTDAQTDKRPAGSFAIFVLVGCYLLVRPEAIAVIACVLIGVLLVVAVRRRLSGVAGNESAALSRRTRSALIVAIVAYGSISVWRLVYFGIMVPEPVVAKAGGLSIDRGIPYIQEHALTRYDSLMWILALAGVALVLFRTMSGRSWSPAALLAALYVLVCSAFVVLAGGDWMPRGRFLVPMIPMAVILGLVFVREMKSSALAPACVVLAAFQLWPVLNVVRFQSPRPLWTLVTRERTHSGFSWLEHVNGEHFRDLPAIVALRDVVDQLRSGRNAPVSIFSGQLGMVPYYLALTHGGGIRLLDRFGLSTRDFTSCPVSSGLPRDAYGLRLDYGFFMKHRAEFRTACGLGDPDVLFDLVYVLSRLEGDPADALAAHGYTLVYNNAARFIAVRGDLANRVSSPARR